MENILIEIVFLVILLLFSAFFSSAETAFTAISRSRARKLVEEKKPGSKELEKLVEDPHRFLSTVLLGNNIVNIMATALATRLFLIWFGNWAIALSTGVMTFLILVFGEITPKTLAIRHAERIALLFSRLFFLVEKVLYPLSRLVMFFSQIIVRLAGEESIKSEPFLTEGEIRALIEIGGEEGLIEEEERTLIHQIFEFGDTVVREIMVPRLDMVSLESKTKIEKALKLALEKGYSRLPVYEGSLDNIRGVVYLKDIVLALSKGEKDKRVEELVRPAYFVPETKKIIELLREMQKNKVHMAIIVDEYGGIAGLVTIEDILEEIVGEIFDEYDVQEALFQPLKKGKILIDTRVSFDEAKEFLGLETSEEEEEEFDTFGGFLYSLFGRIPRKGEKIDYGKWRFEVLKVTGHRIAKVMAEKLGETRRADKKS
jgi:CBS domain containing-hemolysin-like protein